MAKRFLLAPLLLLSLAASAATVSNDDSCDIAVLPAATLLLPHFEVALDAPGRTTLFSLTNVTNVDRIARVTLWTDRSYPVLTFNIFLTGYDVQSINLYDVLAHGVVGTASGTGTTVAKRGAFSDVNVNLQTGACERLPGQLDAAAVAAMRTAFTVGLAGDCAEAGGVHANATGYATIDVVRACTSRFPTERAYWTEDISFDNVLIGDFYQVDLPNAYAQGESMVHIRAVPEGGTPSDRRARPQDFEAGFPATFYSRYIPADLPRRFDGRQPLPSRFAARWIAGGPSHFETFFKIWREGHAGASASCAQYAAEAGIAVVEIVRFDEAENPVANANSCQPFPCPPPPGPPATSTLSVGDPRYFPQLTNAAVAGWLYLNLDNCVGGTCGAVRDASQNWVVTSMRAEGRYSADIPAFALGNGCSRAAAQTEVIITGGPTLGPAPNTRQ